MADADDTKNEEKKEDLEQKKTDEKAEQKTDEKTEATDEKAQKTDEKAALSRFLPWIIMAVIVAVCAGAGFGLGRLFATPAKTETDETPQQKQPTQIEDLKADDSATGSEQTWFYNLEPVIANLDVPGVTRYVRAALTLELNLKVDQSKTTAFLEQKKPLLTNWLTIYLASLPLEDIRGDRNLKRIQTQILDAFNEKLFPDAKPQIKKILFKEFAIQ